VSNGSGVQPESTAPARSDLFAGLRYYPAFVVVVMAGFVASSALTSAFVTHRFVDQVLVPRWTSGRGAWSRSEAAARTGPCGSTPRGR